MIPFAATYALGVLVKSKKFGWVIFGVDVPADDALDRRRRRLRDARQPAAEPRRRHADGDARRNPAATWRARTSASARPPPARGPARRPARRTARSTAFHDSFTPIGGLVPLTNMLLGEVTPGGLGVGLDRHARARDPHGVHRGPDGRPNAGVPRQEDPGRRDEDGGAAHPVRTARHPRLRGRIGRAEDRGELDLEPRTARPVRDRVRVRLGGRQQRLGVRAASRRTRTGTTRRRASRCSSGGSS